MVSRACAGPDPWHEWASYGWPKSPACTYFWGACLLTELQNQPTRLMVLTHNSEGPAPGAQHFCCPRGWEARSTQFVFIFFDALPHGRPKTLPPSFFAPPTPTSTNSKCRLHIPENALRRVLLRPWEKREERARQGERQI